MLPDFINSKRAWMAAGLLIVIFSVVWGVSSYRVARLEKKIQAQEQIVAAKEAEAVLHRQRAAELEKAMATRDQVIAAKDVLINANATKKAELNNQVAEEQKRFEDELASGADLDADQLRERICARFAAARIKAEAYCTR